MTRQTRRIPLDRRGMVEKKPLCKVCGGDDRSHPRPGTLKPWETHKYPQCAGGVIRNPNWLGHRTNEPPVLEKDPKRWITEMFRASLVGIAGVVFFAPGIGNLPTRLVMGIIWAAAALLLYLMLYFDR